METNTHSNADSTGFFPDFSAERLAYFAANSPNDHEFKPTTPQSEPDIFQDAPSHRPSEREINGLERKLESHREKTCVNRVKAAETIKVQHDEDWVGMLKMASQIDERKD